MQIRIGLITMCSTLVFTTAIFQYFEKERQQTKTHMKMLDDSIPFQKQTTKWAQNDPQMSNAQGAQFVFLVQ